MELEMGPIEAKHDRKSYGIPNHKGKSRNREEEIAPKHNGAKVKGTGRERTKI